MTSADSNAIRFLQATCLAMLGLFFLGLNALPRIPHSHADHYSQYDTVPVSKGVGTPRGFFLDEHFATAPVEWRPGGAALANVMNRWQCDPRWTFFALRNDPLKGKAAVLWSKRLFTGDVAVEFYCGIQMDHNRGNPFSYAREINVTIGSDGSDLRKGCTFSFGGHNNTCSFIARDGVDLKREPVRIPVGVDYMRHWYHVIAERNNGKLTFKVDRFLEVGGNKKAEWVVEDARPLDGDRVAIWTYDDGIMLSRVRLSGEGGKLESPDFVAGPVKTIYDE